MKHIIILGDGMADEPIASLGGLTPLQYAQTPYMDELARLGVTGRMKTVADGFHPGSEVANMAVLGYDLPTVYEGRGVLEAASIGVELQPGDMAMRCNLICVEGEILKNHSAGHITTEESDALIQYLNEQLGSERVHFYTGVSYRHLLVIKGGDKRVACTPPHDVPLHPFRPLLVKAEVPEAQATADLLNELILRSQELLKNHPVNLRRQAEGKDMANSIWPWSPGYRPAMRTLKEMYGFERGAVISAVDLIRGIGVYAGLKVLHVEGATGLYDTNYEGKAQAAVDALTKEGYDFAYIHVEAPDEMGHQGSVEKKIQAIENLDQRVIRLVKEQMDASGEAYRMLILPDHPTPIEVRTHTGDPVPYLLYDSTKPETHDWKYNEAEAQASGNDMAHGWDMMKYLFQES